MRIGLLALAVGLWAGAAQAQTITLAPTTLQFTPSADHSAVISVSGVPTTVPVVSSYTVTVFQGTAVVLTRDLGKPAPNAAGLIVILNSAIGGFGGLPKNIGYTATVTAVGAGGATESMPSNPFAFPGAPAAAANVVER